MASVNYQFTNQKGRREVAIHIPADIETHEQLRTTMERDGHVIEGEVRFECGCRDELIFDKLEDVPMHDLKMPCDEDHWAIKWDHPFLINEA